MKILSKDPVKVVTDEKYELEVIKCDVCGCVIKPKPDFIIGTYPKYYEAITGHHDWGNDSWESRKEHDICPDCVTSFISDYFDHTDNSTKYIEIETAYCTPKQISK